VLQDLQGQHRVERLTVPLQLVDVGVDVGLPRGVDVEGQVAVVWDQVPVGGALGADVENPAAG